MSDKVLALYDFSSKQEYIYRTSKIKEISGASALLTDIYRRFTVILCSENIELRYELDREFSTAGFDAGIWDGEVLYDGGGNLMVLWRSAEKYRRANKVISSYLIKNVPGLNLIASHVTYTGLFDDSTDDAGKHIKGDRTLLYEKNRERKNRFPAFDMPAVMPFTQVDPATFMPVTYKRDPGQQGSVYPASQCSLSSDRYAKAAAYSVSSGLEKESEGMLAVIYIDGNTMGNKLMACRSQNYDEGVKLLRAFSSQVNRYYVDKPIEAIEKTGIPFRKVIGGGDEITLICGAKDVFRVMRLYFDELEEQHIELSDQSFVCTSCAGIAVFHAKAPFNVAYSIAEEACEEAKRLAHKTDGNYFCFYYCHAAVTDSFRELHTREQKHASGKPYGTSDLARIDSYAGLLRAAGRANVKALGAAAQGGQVRYRFETERVNAYLPANGPKFSGSEDEMRLVYDMSEFYDLWFSKEESADENNA